MIISVAPSQNWKIDPPWYAHMKRERHSKLIYFLKKWTVENPQKKYSKKKKNKKKRLETENGPQLDEIDKFWVHLKI
jgi:hypothetical protein